MAHTATLFGSAACEKPSVGGLGQKPVGRSTVFHGTCWCTRRGQVRAGQGEAPAEGQLTAFLFYTVLPLSGLQVGCDPAPSVYIAGNRQNVPQVLWHAIMVAATTVVVGQKCLNRNEYILPCREQGILTVRLEQARSTLCG